MNSQRFKETAELIRDNKTYKVYDLPVGNMKLSLTELKSGKKTKGHSHKETDEVYIFTKGIGYIEIIDEGGLNRSVDTVQKGDAVAVPAGSFHRVLNNKQQDCELCFWSIFNKYGDR